MAWSWDQGRLSYFQFGALKKIARISLDKNLRKASFQELQDFVGLPFKPHYYDYPPWRNYSRVFKSTMIVTGGGGSQTPAEPTKVARILATDGGTTTDEYFHFLIQATSDPNPAFRDWAVDVEHRYPLLFSVKYLLAKAAVGFDKSEIGEVISAYESSGFRGDEGQTEFLNLIGGMEHVGNNVNSPRQSAESIRVISQISYLNITGKEIWVSLNKYDAIDIFEQLKPLQVGVFENGDLEIERIADLYESSVSSVELEYPNTVTSNSEEAGFEEGGRIARTHLTIERNSKLRRAFLNEYPEPKCDVCGMITSSSYPWTTDLIDIHHLLPLCSGTRSTDQGTSLDDLVAVCPTCHRAVHKYYNKVLREEQRKDFLDESHARMVYENAKNNYAGFLRW